MGICYMFNKDDTQLLMESFLLSGRFEVDIIRICLAFCYLSARFVMIKFESNSYSITFSTSQCSDHSLGKVSFVVKEQ